MERNLFVCFSTKQLRFVSWLLRRKLITPIGATSIKHPITGKEEIQIQSYEARKIVSKCSQCDSDEISAENNEKILFKAPC